MKKKVAVVSGPDNSKIINNKKDIVGNKSVFSILATIIYLSVHFMPDLGGADVMGAQWLFSGIVDLFVLGYIALNAEYYKEAIASVFKFKFTLLYSVFVLWALGSYFYAINGIESLVCLARLVSTYLIFINLSILFYQQEYKWLLLWVSYLVTIVLVIDAYQVLSKFVENVNKGEDLNQNILSLMGKHGNKNVMAANLMIKIPFCLLVIMDNKLFSKIIGIIGMIAGLTSLFILNTRSTYVAIILIFIVFVVFAILNFNNEKDKVRKILIRISYFIIPLILSYFIANSKIQVAKDRQDTDTGGYGLVADRFQTINFKDNENSRIHLWKSAIDYFKKNPLLGAGYGNWKLASIPYEKELANELFVPYHAHNDFVENAAELGILGGAAYLGLFIFAFIYFIRTWFNVKYHEYREGILIGFLGICCYGIDALFNFPAERTGMQTMFTVTAALLFAPFYIVNYNSAAILRKFTKYFSNIYLILAFLLILPSLYISKQVFDSLKIQRTVMGEINANPMFSTDSAVMMPNIPNLSTSALPISALKARYYIRDSNFTEAIHLLRESYNDNPYIHYNDFLLTSVYASLKNYDSTLFYAKQAFYNWPRATSYYKNMVFAAVRKKDTVELDKAFATSLKYSNSALTYEEYIKGSFELRSKPLNQLIALLDKAANKFPKEDFSKTRLLLNSNGLIAPTTNNFAVLGLQSFQKGNYLNAAENYKQAIAIEPSNYTHFENAGICLYSAKKFNECLYYFEKAAAFAENNTGKSEYYIGLSLLNLGKKDQACQALNKSKVKGFADAANMIKGNCK
jgi:O-antigen ligase